jgi:hypothetical protein
MRLVVVEVKSNLFNSLTLVLPESVGPYISDALKDELLNMLGNLVCERDIIFRGLVPHKVGTYSSVNWYDSYLKKHCLIEVSSTIQNTYVCRCE